MWEQHLTGHVHLRTEQSLFCGLSIHNTLHFFLSSKLNHWRKREVNVKQIIIFYTDVVVEMISAPFCNYQL